MVLVCIVFYCLGLSINIYFQRPSGITMKDIILPFLRFCAVILLLAVSTLLSVVAALHGYFLVLVINMLVIVVLALHYTYSGE